MPYDHADVERALRLRKAGYLHLRRFDELCRAKRLPPAELERILADQASAAEWLRLSTGSLPPELRPAPGDREALAGLLTSYLRTTFALDLSPGRRLHSEGGHCFCPWCSFMVDNPFLRPRKLGRREKERADELRRARLRRHRDELGLVVDDAVLNALAKDAERRPALSLCAYVDDLFRRFAGGGDGPAALALWRDFAWKPTGSPRHAFRLTARDVLAAERTWRDALTAAAAERPRGGGSEAPPPPRGATPRS
jgi:hypothetical protein